MNNEIKPGDTVILTGCVSTELEGILKGRFGLVIKTTAHYCEVFFPEAKPSSDFYLCGDRQPHIINYMLRKDELELINGNEYE